MNQVIDLPNLFYIMQELVKERCYTDEEVDISFRKDYQDLATITVWHHSKKYPYGCKYLDIKEGDCIDSAYQKLEVVKHLMKNGGLLNELQDRA
ncbi:hypothetical protein [Macrococcoides caseolyticum]|uniref:Uncharacterized protein n=1 Tax=Macrococcoides caseolyticum TaxID=69966 RepID=A0ACC9MNS4_9STAP|nr:hypothetical protein [Macrococcus caseolyticus]PKE55487.1 hypothetical protein CW682_11725 [Macrococcus caseolyticus]